MCQEHVSVSLLFGPMTVVGAKSSSSSLTYVEPCHDLSPGENVTRVVAGYQHTCVLQGDAMLVCWGDNSHGQLGIGSTQNVGAGPGVTNLTSVNFGPGALPGPRVSVGWTITNSLTASSFTYIYCSLSNCWFYSDPLSSSRRSCRRRCWGAVSYLCSTQQ